MMAVSLDCVAYNMQVLQGIMFFFFFFFFFLIAVILLHVLL